MILKKKKLLNVKYKRTPESLRLLDKQFSITDRDRFSVNIKDVQYVFEKTDEKNDIYTVSNGLGGKSLKVEVGNHIKLPHKDGTNVHFQLHKDFLYSLDYSIGVYCGMVVLFLIALGFAVPDMSIESNVVTAQKEEVDVKRVNELIKKLEEKKVVEKKPEPKKEPPKPKPEPKKEVAKQEVPKKLEKPKEKKVSLNPTPEKAPERKSVKISNDKVPPQRLVVQQGPPVRGGTGPQNPNASTNTAARSKATSIAMTTAKVSSALGFLAKGKGLVNVPPGVQGGSNRFIGGRGLAGAKNVNGKNFLAKLSNENSTGSQNGPISTSGSRTIATGPVISDGEINGVAGGKALNYVQGKVSVQGLHAAGGSGGISFGPSRSMSIDGQIDQDAVRKAIEAAMSKLQYCYEKQLLAKPSLRGNLQIKWAINPGGRASGTNVVQSSLNDQKVHDCVMGVIKTIAFPSPKGGPATVSYPFNFQSSSL